MKSLYYWRRDENQPGLRSIPACSLTQPCLTLCDPIVSASTALAGRFFTNCATWKALRRRQFINYLKRKFICLSLCLLNSSHTFFLLWSYKVSKEIKLLMFPNFENILQKFKKFSGYSYFQSQWLGFPGSSVVKNLPANMGHMGSILSPGRFHTPCSH